MSDQNTAPAPQAGQSDGQRGASHVGSGDLVRHVFPKIPERDEHGNACLYPGFTKFEGIAALFNTPHGEVVVLAPTLAALDDQVRYMGITGCLSKEKCAITEARRLPNVGDETRTTSHP